MDSPPPPKRLHKSSSPSSGIWILLHSQKASQEFISKFWHMDSPPLPKGFTRVHLQVLGYGFSYTPQRLHKSSSPSFGIWILLLHSPKASHEFISKFWDMDSPITLPKGFTRVHLQVLGYGFLYYTPQRLHNCSYCCLNLNFVKFEIAIIHMSLIIQLEIAKYTFTHPGEKNTLWT
jgi:hypothetical protein